MSAPDSFPRGSWRSMYKPTTEDLHCGSPVGDFLCDHCQENVEMAYIDPTIESRRPICQRKETLEHLCCSFQD